MLSKGWGFSVVWRFQDFSDQQNCDSMHGLRNCHCPTSLAYCCTLIIFLQTFIPLIVAFQLLLYRDNFTFFTHLFKNQHFQMYTNVDI